METQLSMVEPTAQVHPSAKIWHPVKILGGARIGEGCVIGPFTEIGQFVHIGDNTKIGTGTFIPSGIRIGSNVFIAPRVTFCNVRNPRAWINRHSQFDSDITFVGSNSTIGAGALILPRILIGRFAFVAAGSVVTHNVDEYAMVMGVPARFVKRVSTTLEELNP